MSKINDTFPVLDVSIVLNGEMSQTSTEELVKGKNLVLVGVPGAFTPTCHVQHLPSYIENIDLFNKKDYSIIFMSVNDPFVMKAWEENSNSKNITMIADGNGNLTDSLDLAMDGSAFSLGKRCQRFAMIIQDGIIKEINTENGPGLDRSSAESTLKSI
jgi:peroxiredoxin